jgi:hypothetical protein
MGSGAVGMKEIDYVFKDIEKAFKDTERALKQVDSDMTEVFKRMDKIFEDMDRVTGNVARKTEVSPWKQWFAWRPVVLLNGERVWLKKVFRRCINTYVDMDNWKRYEYGSLFDVIKGD